MSEAQVGTWRSGMFYQSYRINADGTFVQCSHDHFTEELAAECQELR